MSETKRWTDADITEAFVKVAKPDGTVGPDEIMFVIKGMRDDLQAQIDEYRFGVVELKQQLAVAQDELKEFEGEL